MHIYIYVSYIAHTTCDFFHLFKRNPQFLEGMFNACNRMNTDVGKRVMEVVKHVLHDRKIKKIKILSYYS